MSLNRPVCTDSIVINEYNALTVVARVLKIWFDAKCVSVVTALFTSPPFLSFVPVLHYPHLTSLSFPLHLFPQLLFVSNFAVLVVNLLELL